METQMNREKVVLSIIKDTGLSREEIEEMVEEKRTILKGKISIEDALLIIIKELVVEYNSKVNKRNIIFWISHNN